MTLVFGHRGARGEAPENSIAGFAHAKRAGVAGIETDIALTADFVPVLHHDPQLADGRLIRALRFAELDGIPTLVEALEAVPDVDWLLEIKTFPPAPWLSHEPAEMVRAVCAALARARVPPGRVAILAFDWAVLAQAAEQAPELARVCLTAPPEEAARGLWWGDGFEALSTPRAVARFGAKTWAPQHASATAARIAEARALGLRIIPWTVNDPTDVARLSPLVDGIITDYPARYLQAR
jgi:glycerophosphoryl diester phosphodiesterase